MVSRDIGAVYFFEASLNGAETKIADSKYEGRTALSVRPSYLKKKRRQVILM